MRVLNLKNLKNYRNVGITLYGNYGLKAIKIPSGKTVFRIQKRIKSSNYLSPFNGTIGSFPEMSIKEAELEALRICALCDKGIHPREHEREKRNKEPSSLKKRKKQVQTLSEVLEKYIANKKYIYFLFQKFSEVFFLLYDQVNHEKPQYLKLKVDRIMVRILNSQILKLLKKKY